MINIMFPLKDISVDVIKFGTMYTVSHLITGGALSDAIWQRSTLFSLLGFAIYHLSTRNFIYTGEEDTTTKRTLDTTNKFGTMLLVARLLSGNSIMDTTWIFTTLATLFGFAVYDIWLFPYIRGEDLTYSPPLQKTINDWGKFGVMYLVSRLISCKSILDPVWIMATLASLVGFTVYDVVLSDLTERLFRVYWY